MYESFYCRKLEQFSLETLKAEKSNGTLSNSLPDDYPPGLLATSGDMLYTKLHLLFQQRY